MVGFVEHTVEGPARETRDFGNKADGVFGGGEQVDGMAQTVAVDEVGDASTIGAGTDGIGHIVLVGAKKLCQTGTVQFSVGVDLIGAV